MEDSKDTILISQLADGFAMLMAKVDRLVARNAALEEQMRDYQQEKVASATSTISQSPVRLERAKDNHKDPSPEWRKEGDIARGIEAWRRLKDLQEQEQPPKLRPKELETTHEALEQDFTTHGAKGELKCPFAERAAVRQAERLSNSQHRPRSLPTPPDLKASWAEDPIAAEFHADDIGSPPPSAGGSATRCPIRFLDDHSPEEIAKYFENHKHEIPRSHEICVKRFQSNADSIRQLDAKYGDLVNMIQGLGVKHQPMLPSGEDAGKSSVSPGKESSDKIERWAESVPPGESEDGNDEAGAERTGHFERPLQEVRLGESPSRPWGIQVPLDKQTAASADPNEIASNAAQSMPAPGPASVHADPVKQPPGKCPFDHLARDAQTKLTSSVEPQAPSADKPRTAEQTSVERSSAASIVFNGPVFFGYPASNVSEMLKSFHAVTAGEASTQSRN